MIRLATVAAALGALLPLAAAGAAPRFDVQVAANRPPCADVAPGVRCRGTRAPVLEFPMALDAPVWLPLGGGSGGVPVHLVFAGPVVLDGSVVAEPALTLALARRAGNLRLTAATRGAAATAGLEPGAWTDVIVPGAGRFWIRVVPAAAPE